MIAMSGSIWNTKSQAWSIEAMIAVVIFLGVIFLFFSFFNANSGTKGEELEEDAEKLIGDIYSENPNVDLLDGNKINSTKAEDLLGMNYSDIKSQLNIRNDFCLYFEDENGNIIFINYTHSGIGSSSINVSNVSCG